MGQLTLAATHYLENRITTNYQDWGHALLTADAEHFGGVHQSDLVRNLEFAGWFETGLSLERWKRDRITRHQEPVQRLEKISDGAISEWVRTHLGVTSSSALQIWPHWADRFGYRTILISIDQDETPAIALRLNPNHEIIFRSQVLRPTPPTVEDIERASKLDERLNQGPASTESLLLEMNWSSNQLHSACAASSRCFPVGDGPPVFSAAYG